MKTIQDLLGPEAEPVSQEACCAECNATFVETFDPSLAQFFTGDRYCDACCARQVAEETAANDERIKNSEIARLRAAWEQISPPLYQNTDLKNKSLSQTVIMALKEWDWRKGYWIGLVGTTGKGKTRVAFEKLNRIHMSGESVFAISAKKLERFVQNTFSDDRTEKEEARAALKRCRTATVLLLDDIGKEKYTERVASELYDLVEYRTANILPTIWTSNSTLSQLGSLMGDNHAAPTLRRIQQFSHIVNADGPITPLEHAGKPDLKVTRGPKTL